MRPAQDSVITIDIEEEEREEVTGIYNASFFKTHTPAKTALQNLEDAAIGFKLFMEEAEQALSKCDLTVDQRIHVSTILSYVDGLNRRFEHVRQPGFVQRRSKV